MNHMVFFKLSRDSSFLANFFFNDNFMLETDVIESKTFLLFVFEIGSL